MWDWEASHTYLEELLRKALTLTMAPHNQIENVGLDLSSYKTVNSV